MRVNLDVSQLRGTDSDAVPQKYWCIGAVPLKQEQHISNSSPFALCQPPSLLRTVHSDRNITSSA